MENCILLWDVVVNKGFDNNPAVRFADSGKACFFSVGERVYDKKADNNYRYINHEVKVIFEHLVERIKKMNLGEGAYVQIRGHLDEESWDDKQTGNKRSKKVVILQDINYSYSGNNSSNKDSGGSSNGNGGQNGYGNGNGQNGYGNPGMGAMPQYGQQMPPQYQQQPPQQAPMPQQGQMPQGFTGYENFGGNGNGGNPYFSNQG